jgi:hypothetical protein
LIELTNLIKFILFAEFFINQSTNQLFNSINQHLCPMPFAPSNQKSEIPNPQSKNSAFPTSLAQTDWAEIMRFTPHQYDQFNRK